MRNRNEIILLVVDDEIGLRESLTENLVLDGFKILAASCGNEAIELLKTNAIDFVISDVRMPNGDGVFLLKYMKENFLDIPPIVLVSGYTKITAMEVKQLGGIDLLSKPLDFDRLIDLIKGYCTCS